MKMTEAKGLLDQLASRYPDQQAYVTLPVPDGPGEEEVGAFMKELRDKGYACMLRTTAFGDEIVVTDKVESWVRSTCTG